MNLQPKLNVNVSQRQVLTPGMVQMVRVLALNKIELKEMINTEVVENPVLEEIEDHTPSLEEIAAEEGSRERSVAEQTEQKTEKDPFEEVDFGSYFQEYMDPGFRAPSMFEEFDKPSFEHFLSNPTTLTDHLDWQIGAMSLSEDVRSALEFLIGNLDENGYLTASEEELQSQLTPERLQSAREVLRQLDPTGVGARDLRECLQMQAEAVLRDLDAALVRGEEDGFAHLGEYESLIARRAVAACALQIVQSALSLVERGDTKEIARKLKCSAEHVQPAIALIRTFNPRPGQRYNQSETRLIEPDVAFVRRGDDFIVVMNDDDMPNLRLNAGYRRMLHQKNSDKELREYVKERYRSAIQLLRNIEQRKNTIVRTCDAIVRRQRDFLEKGIDALRPMMIKEVAEEIGVHPSTVSRAVANKYVHTAQGVYELRFFFSEGVNGPEGGDLPLLLLKKKVRGLIEAEDPAKPLTDDALAAELNRQGINVTRRTVAKYREDMQIPSTHKRRRRN
ncbi:MAG: RNA polymerase factor sigma-54 [Acidobacteria bacterium]|nr:RNA polymerase factor sigma-54 [Acidobacteriota bacterium]